MKILIALDESPVSSRAAREAVRLFGGSDNAFLVINVAAIPTPWVGSTGFGVVAPLNVEPRWLLPQRDDGADEEADLEALAGSFGIPDPKPVAASGDPVTQICVAADEHDADVIVVGSHDKTALRRLFDPSVAAGVVRETYRPVLVVSGTPPT